MRTDRHSPLSRIVRQGSAIAWSVIVMSSIAHAHGGMAGPDDLGPPLFTSAALAFVCYWVVLLWPASKRKRSDHGPNGTKMPINEQRRAVKRTYKRSAPKQASQLRKLDASRTRSESGRKVSDA